MKAPILITGAARSGTSLVAGVIDKCGAFGGQLRQGGQHNQKGQYENIKIVNEIVKPYLRSIGCDPLGQKPLPQTDRLADLPALRNRVVAAMTDEGLLDNAQWYYKGAKMCLIWPLWHKAFPEAKWVIVRRNPDDIAASCMRTRFMSAYRTAEGWLQWVDHHIKCFDEMKQAGLNISEVWPDKAIKGDTKEFENMINWLGLKWNEKKVAQFLTPELWRGSSKNVR